jgi:N-acetylglucosaminyl-diphospho-decaprenol L-rhamnosyltransferase
VTDVLPVVTVTYSPGHHLERFLATLSLATERPVSVLLADNGSTDGTPQAAVERYPNVRLFDTGANLGYGTAVNRAVTQLDDGGSDDGDWVIVANPDGSVYPSARHLPSLIRGGMHAVIGPFWKRNPWTAAYRQEHLEPSERVVGWLSGSCLLVRRSAFSQVGGFDERYFMYMEDVDLGDRLGKAGWLSVYVPSSEVLHHKGHSTGHDPASHLAAHHQSTYIFLADRYSGWRRAPLRWTLRASLRVRSHLMVRSSLRTRRRKPAEGRR